jgi:predicted CXXCH cytochrome family protein
MRARTRERLLHACAGLVVVASLGGCVDEKIVYRNGTNFAAPPTAAASFLGYDDAATKLPVCGNCHVGQQARWKTTKHADAWHTLEASGAMQGVCQACHSVNDKGNAVSDTAVGFRSTKDVRYHDVQCESCHGPGLQHVQAPTRGQMLPSIHADTGKGVTNGCSECHSGTHHPFVEEWRSSRHSTSYTRAYNGATATAPDVPNGPRSACQGCHIGQFVLANWGVNTNYVEKALGQTLATGEGVTCVVCHDPHGSDNPAQLRYPIDTPDPEQNLCVKCHNRRGNPDFTGSRDEPHAAHGPLIYGTAGWWPPGLEFDEAQSSHGPTRNPQVCTTCHVRSYDVTDKATGKFVVHVTGHRFDPIPCVDANGQPTGAADCVITARSFKACAASGCNSELTARTAMQTATADIQLLVTALNGMLAKVPASEFAAGKVTTARGSRFNANLAVAAGSEVHNPFLVKALLRASIAQVSKDYGIPSPVGLVLAPYDTLILRH